MSRYHKWDRSGEVDRCTRCTTERKFDGRLTLYRLPEQNWELHARVPPCEPAKSGIEVTEAQRPETKADEDAVLLTSFRGALNEIGTYLGMPGMFDLAVDVPAEVKRRLTERPGHRGAGRQAPPQSGQARKKSTEEEALAAANRLEVFKLKTYKYLSFRQIEEHTDGRISKSAAGRYFRDYHLELEDETAEVYELWRATETSRYEEQRRDLQALLDEVASVLIPGPEGHTPVAIDKDAADVRIRTHNAIRGIAERFAKLLGLDAPTQILIAAGVKEYVKRIVTMLQEDKPELAAGVAEYFHGRLDE